MPAEIRKTLLHVEKTLIEGNRPAKKPLVLIAAVAVIKTHGLISKIQINLSRISNQVSWMSHQAWEKC